MRAAIMTSVSRNIAEMASLTVPNKLEYCLRHGYSLIVENRPYHEVASSMVTLCSYLDQFDFLWCLDSDAVITDMSTPFHELPCIGPHATVCEEGIVEWNWVNCGSVVWRNTAECRTILSAIHAEEQTWRQMPCSWQTWFGDLAKSRPDLISVAPVGSFNSCEWTHPGGGPTKKPGSHWMPGHLVWHPCGVFPMADRVEAIRNMLNSGVCR
jgi:hypothetical protein